MEKGFHGVGRNRTKGLQVPRWSRATGLSLPLRLRQLMDGRPDGRGGRKPAPDAYVIVSRPSPRRAQNQRGRNPRVRERVAAASRRSPAPLLGYFAPSKRPSHQVDVNRPAGGARLFHLIDSSSRTMAITVMRPAKAAKPAKTAKAHAPGYQAAGPKKQRQCVRVCE